jgi:hypothetical protein
MGRIVSSKRQELPSVHVTVVAEIFFFKLTNASAISVVRDSIQTWYTDQWSHKSVSASREDHALMTNPKSGLISKTHDLGATSLIGRINLGILDRLMLPLSQASQPLGSCGCAF